MTTTLLQRVQDEADLCRNEGASDIAALLDEVAAALAHPAQAVPAGWMLVPDWKGYARLGTGNYIINHSRAPADPELGAEIVITLADDSDRSGGRQVGESRDNPPDAPPIQPDEMVIRIGFVNEGGLFALEDQLRMLRMEHGWTAMTHWADLPTAPEVKP